MNLRTLALAGALTLTVVLAGCTGAADDGAPGTPAAGASDEASTGEEQAGTDTEIGVVTDEVTPVGGTFSTIFDGEFDLEYLGLADLGTVDGGAGDIRCYGVLANVTLTAIDDSFDTGAIAVSFTRVLDADALDVGAVDAAACPRDLSAAGWADLATTKFPKDQVGVPVDDLLVATVAVPVGEVDKAVTVSLTSMFGSPAVAFEVTETV